MPGARKLAYAEFLIASDITELIFVNLDLTGALRLMIEVDNAEHLGILEGKIIQ